MISEERVRYLLEVVGAQSAEGAFRRTAAAIDSSRKAADLHSEALRANARMAEVMQRSAERAAVAQRAMATSAEQASKSSLSFSQGAQRTAITVGGLANAATGLVPAFDGAGAAITRASGVIGAMTQLMGGPVGVAIGAAAAAMGVFAIATEESREKLKSFNEEVERSNELADAAFAARMQRGNAASSAAAAKMAADLRERVALQSQGLPTTRPDLQAGLDEVARQEAVFAAAGLGPGASVEGRGRARPRPTDNGLMVTRLSPVDQAIEASRRRDAMLGRINIDDSAVDQAGASSMQKTEAEFAAQRQAIADLRSDKRTAHEEEMRMLDEREARSTAYHSALREEGHAAYTMVAAGAANAFAAIARGEKVSLKMILQSVGSEAIARGTMNMFEALFKLANPLTAPTGSAQLAPALGMIAFGTGLAGAGAAAGGGASAGGGGGGAGPSGPILTTRPSTDTGAPTAHTVVNVKFDTIMQPSGSDGQRVQQALEEQRRHGL